MRRVVLFLVVLAFVSSPADAAKGTRHAAAHAKAAPRAHATKTTTTPKAPAIKRSDQARL